MNSTKHRGCNPVCFMTMPECVRKIYDSGDVLFKNYKIGEHSCGKDRVIEGKRAVDPRRGLLMPQRLNGIKTRRFSGREVTAPEKKKAMTTMLGFKI